MLCSGGASIALFAAPAMAQDTPAPQDSAAAPAAPAPQDQAAPASSEGDIVVTGTLFRTNRETVSPVTTLTNENLEKAGITNVADAVRSISADNSGSIPSAFANGFGSGAAGVSLRGLTVNSTLVLIDGIRTTNYPYADDGQRAFVDLNSIQKSNIERIDVLKDGASSTYGADAIGGVVNIITRKEIQGIEGTVEGGISQRGDGGEQRLTLSAGYGDLSTQGFNVYITGEYEHDGLIGANQRKFPYNTADLTSIGGDNNNVAAPGLGAFGTTLGATSAVVRPARETVAGDIFSGQFIPDPADPTGGTALPTRILNPNGCLQNGLTTPHTDETGDFCEENVTPYGTLQPEQKRYGATAHLTANVGGNAQAYLTGTYYHSSVFSEAAPWRIRQRNPINSTNIVLPALLANGQLNPNNPYAVAGCVEGISCVDAQVSYAFGDIPQSATTDNDTYRVAGGISGKFGDGWSYSFDATYARSDLKGTNKGYLNIAGLTSAIMNGTYNFIDPSQNSQAVRDSISPDVITEAHSTLAMAQANIAKDLFSLPGGPLQVAVGGSIRRETLNNPNANANNAYLGLNAVTASGRRTIYAAYFEVNAPILPGVNINGSGRYDNYSDGFSNFSPKVGATWKPFHQLMLRGTFSKGFRAPSFAESQSGAVIGYTTATPPCSAILAHGGTGTVDSCSGGNAYVAPYSIGFNSASNPDLKPEKSRSFTAGAVVEPTRWLTFTADYYNIRKTDVIAGGPLSGAAVDAYYSGQALPAGYTLTLDDPDPAFPNAIRKILIVNSPYANAASLLTSGIDVSLEARVPLGGGVRLTSRLEGTEIFNYNFDGGDGNVLHYVGTQAPYVLSSGAGTPRWRANWMNSIEAGKFTLTGTAYYTSGYKNVAEDQNGFGARTCVDQLYSTGADGTGETFCHTKGFFDLDLVAQFKVNDKFTFYANVINLLDASAPLNPANYAGAAANYNPTWTQTGIVGRYFRAGANFKF
jgi:iron complex outermembrane receptor protein